MSVPASKLRLNLDEFTLSTATFEARAERNLLHWDRAGLLWTQFLKKRPKLKNVQAAPDATSFKLENLTFTVRLDPAEEHTSIAITDQRPDRSLKALSDLADEFLDVSTRVLEVEEFKRLGLRLFFIKEFRDLKEATEALLSTGLIRFPPGPHFGIEGSPAQPSYILRWEDGKKGAMIHLTAQTRKFEFTAPAQWEGMESFSRESSRVLFDFDYFTIATVKRSQLRVPDWIQSAFHMNRRDSNKFLRGLSTNGQSNS